MFRALAHIFYQSIAFAHDILLNFTFIFSVLRTRPCGKFFSTVEVKAASTPSHLVELHPLCRAVIYPLLRLCPLSGTSILVLLPIM
jgi:hypothetical protein